MEAGKRLALDQLIDLAIPMGTRIHRLALSITCKKQSSVLRLRQRFDEIEMRFSLKRKERRFSTERKMGIRQMLETVCLLTLFSSIQSFSLANSAPTDITFSEELTIAENTPVGIIIGQFNSIDPDGDSNITYSILPELPENLSPIMWLDATDRISVVEELGKVSEWKDKSNPNNSFIQTDLNSKPSYKTVIYKGLNVIDFDGNDFLKSKSSFATGSDFDIMMFAKIDSVQDYYSSIISSRGSPPDFQFASGNNQEFRFRVLSNDIFADKTFSQSKLHDAGIWHFSFNFSKTEG